MVEVKLKNNEITYISAKNVESISKDPNDDLTALVTMTSGAVYEVAVHNNTEYYLLINKITEEDNNVCS